MPFIGKQSSGHSKIKKSRFTATASQTDFSVTTGAGDELQVFLNGVLLKENDDYTYTTSTVTLGTGASVNDIVEVHVYQSFTIADTVDIAGDTMTGELEVPTVKLSSNVIKASDGGSTITLDDSDNVTIGGDLKVTNLKHASSGSNNLVLESDGTTTTTLSSSANIKSAINASGSAPIYACRAWVNFNGTGTVAIRGSGNVSSITDDGTGRYTVNLTTEMSDSNYCVTTSGSKNESSTNLQDDAVRAQELGTNSFKLHSNSRRSDGSNLSDFFNVFATVFR